MTGLQAFPMIVPVGLSNLKTFNSSPLSNDWKFRTGGSSQAARGAWISSAYLWKGKRPYRIFLPEWALKSLTAFHTKSSEKNVWEDELSMGANAHSRDFYWDHSTSLIELREKREYGYLSFADQQRGWSLKIDIYENVTIHYTCLIKTPPQKCIRKIISMGACCPDNIDDFKEYIGKL